MSITRMVTTAAVTATTGFGGRRPQGVPCPGAPQPHPHINVLRKEKLVKYTTLSNVSAIRPNFGVKGGTNPSGHFQTQKGPLTP